MNIEPLIATMCVGVLCALLGVFVTARGMSFFSDTIAHAALLGIALGMWWQLTDMTVPVIATSLVVAGIFLWLKENTRLMPDTVMALLLSGSVSLGMLLMDRMGFDDEELHDYLFGNLMSVGGADLMVIILLLMVTAGWVFFCLSPLTILTLQQELATVSGVKVHRLNFVFVFILTLVVAVSIQLVGIILITSLLVIPPAAARNISRSFRQQILLSLVVGLTGGTAGALVSAYLESEATGPIITLSCIGLFMVTLIAGKWKANRRKLG